MSDYAKLGEEMRKDMLRRALKMEDMDELPAKRTANTYFACRDAESFKASTWPPADLLNKFLMQHDLAAIYASCNLEKCASIEIRDGPRVLVHYTQDWERSSPVAVIDVKDVAGMLGKEDVLPLTEAKNATQ